MPRRSKRPKPKFYLKEPKATVPTSIYLIYYYGLDKPLKYSIGEHILPKYWNQKLQVIRAGKYASRYAELEEYMNEVKTTAFDIFKEMGVISIKDFKKALDIRLGFAEIESKERMTLIEFIPHYLAKLEANPKYNENTIKNMKSWKVIFFDYCQFIGKELDFEDIDWNWLNDFQTYCFQEKELSINYVKRGISQIKQFVNEGRKSGYTDNTLVMERGFNIKATGTTKIVFWFDEFEKLFNLDLPDSQKLRDVWSLIFIGGFTGMRHSDWHKIEKDMIKEIDNEKFIEVYTKKTGAMVAVPLDPMLEKVLEMNNYKVPEVERTEFSKEAKLLWEMAGANETIEKIDSSGGKVVINRIPKYKAFHPHSLRRSFASNFYLMGLPANWLMNITGHSSEKQFFQYVSIEKRLTASYISRYMKQLAKVRDIKPPLKAVK